MVHIQSLNGKCHSPQKLVETPPECLSIISQLVTLSLKTDCDGFVGKENSVPAREEGAVLSRKRKVLMPPKDFHTDECTGVVERNSSVESFKLMTEKLCEIDKSQPLPILTWKSSIGEMSDQMDGLSQSSDCDFDNEIMTTNMPGYQHASFLSRKRGRSRSSSPEGVLSPLSTGFWSRSPSPELETLKRTKSTRSRNPFMNWTIDRNSRFHQRQRSVYRRISSVRIVNKSVNSAENTNKENDLQCQASPNICQSISDENNKSDASYPELLSAISNESEEINTTFTAKGNFYEPENETTTAPLFPLVADIIPSKADIPEKIHQRGGKSRILSPSQITADTVLDLQNSSANFNSMAILGTHSNQETSEYDQINIQENDSYSIQPPTPDTILTPEIRTLLPSPDATTASIVNNLLPTTKYIETSMTNSPLSIQNVTDASTVNIPLSITEATKILIVNSPINASETSALNSSLPNQNTTEVQTVNSPLPALNASDASIFSSSVPNQNVSGKTSVGSLTNTPKMLPVNSSLPISKETDKPTASILSSTQDDTQTRLTNGSSLISTLIHTLTLANQRLMKRQLFGNPSTNSISNSGLSNIYKCPLTCLICYPINRKFNTFHSQSKSVKKQRRDICSVTKKRKFGIKRFQKITTRSSNRRLRQRTPNHAFQHVFMTKIEVFKAVEEGDLELVKTLVQDTGATVRREKTNCTLLHVAAAKNHPDVVLFLLQLISPNVVNKDGQTPAHLAAMKGHTQVLRILVGDMEFDSNKLDKGQKTYNDLLSETLLNSLIAGDIMSVKSLVKAGADPDMQVKGSSCGILSRELSITTPRLLAQNLHQHHFLHTVSKTDGGKNKAEAKKSTSHLTLKSSLKRKCSKIHGRNIPYSLKLSLTTSGQQMSGPDVYKMDTDPRGYVCVLNYNTFQNRPDLHLQGSHSDVNNLANIFGKMRYTGDVHSSLSLKETKDVLLRVRDMEVLDDVGCAIFIISSHGVGHDSFLTGDMNYLRTEWVMNLFRDSECPRLKNKPKMFIFNMHNNPVVGMNTADEPVFVLPRLTEPLYDTVCLHATGVWPSSFNSSMDGTPFITSLCRSLALYAHHKELGDLYKECLTELKKVTQDIVPQLRNFGFTKKFYFNPKFQL